MRICSSWSVAVATAGSWGSDGELEEALNLGTEAGRRMAGGAGLGRGWAVKSEGAGWSPEEAGVWPSDMVPELDALGEARVEGGADGGTAATAAWEGWWTADTGAGAGGGPW